MSRPVWGSRVAPQRDGQRMILTASEQLYEFYLQTATHDAQRDDSGRLLQSLQPAWWMVFGLRAICSNREMPDDWM